MKKILTYIAGATLLMPILASCSSDDKDEDAGTIWDKYEEYREANLTWIAEQETRLNPDGTKYYERLQPAWNVNSYILIHWFNDREETAGNLVPLLTSSVRARYIGRNYLGQVFDADSTSENGTYFLVSQVVPGWQLALQNIACRGFGGDSPPLQPGLRVIKSQHPDSPLLHPPVHDASPRHPDTGSPSLTNTTGADDTRQKHYCRATHHDVKTGIPANDKAEQWPCNSVYPLWPIDHAARHLYGCTLSINNGTDRKPKVRKAYKELTTTHATSLTTLILREDWGNALLSDNIP